MDLLDIQQLIDLLKLNGIKSFSIKEVDGKELQLEFKENLSQHVVVEDVAVQAPKQKGVGTHANVKAEMVGTIYLSVAPQKPKFVEIGSKVQKGQTLCLIEAMKTYFEVKSQVEGTVQQIHIEDKQPVEFGTPLFSIV